jgi:hypothetical protein
MHSDWLAVSLEGPKSQSAKVGRAVEYKSDSKLNNVRTIGLYFITTEAKCELIQGVNKCVLVNTICETAQNIVTRKEVSYSKPPASHSCSNIFPICITSLLPEALQITISPLLWGQGIQP